MGQVIGITISLYIGTHNSNSHEVGEALLLETGSYFLLETGDKLLLDYPV